VNHFQIIMSFLAPVTSLWIFGFDGGVKELNWNRRKSGLNGPFPVLV